MAERQLPKLHTRVRFPSPAPDPCTRRYLGIDFSGGAPAWRPRCRRPTVWIATIVAEDADAYALADVRPVQDLEGEGAPFDRLIRRLQRGDFAAAGIDAPFSIPHQHLPAGGHAELLSRVLRMPAAQDRPFPRGRELIALADSRRLLEDRKPRRVTEQRFNAQRSTLWNEARPGAPFAVACLALLARAERPIWPWSTGPGMLVEAYPAAQLATWGLPHQGYGRAEQSAKRAEIVDGLQRRVRLDPRWRETLIASADALDAVVAAFGAVAAATGTHIAHEGPADEGLIAVEAP